MSERFVPTAAVATRDANDTSQAPQASGEQHAQVAKILGRGSFRTKVVNGAEPMELVGHSVFREDRVVADLAQTKDPDELLRRERAVMIQIERMRNIACLLRLAGRLGGTQQVLRRLLVQVGEAADQALFDTMTSVQTLAHESRQAVHNYCAFLRMGRVQTSPKASELIGVANIPGESFLSHPQFGEPPYYGPLEGQALLKTGSHVGLIVLDSKVRTLEASANAGMKALKGSYVIVDSVDWRDIDPLKRRDEMGARLREEAETSDDAKLHGRARRTPLNREDLELLFRVWGDKEGMERVVLAFNPLVVEEASRFERDLGGVVAAPSFVFAGLLFFSAVISRERSACTAFDAPSKANQIVIGEPLFDLEGNLHVVSDLPIAITTRADVLGDPNPVNYLDGKHVARGRDPEYQVGAVCTKEFVRRVLYTWGRMKYADPIANRGKLRAGLEAALQKGLVGGPDDGTKPLLELEVLDDRSSVAGKAAEAAGGIRFLVRLKPKFGIEKMEFVILTKDGEGMNGVVTGDV